MDLRNEREEHLDAFSLHLSPSYGNYWFSTDLNGHYGHYTFMSIYGYPSPFICCFSGAWGRSVGPRMWLGWSCLWSFWLPWPHLTLGQQCHVPWFVSLGPLRGASLLPLAYLSLCPQAKAIPHLLLLMHFSHAEQENLLGKLRHVCGAPPSMLHFFIFLMLDWIHIQPFF